jgi:ankyrin repeat protein
MMNWLVRSAMAAALIGVAAPSAAQSTGYEGAKFVDAVREGKTNEAFALLDANPNIVDARNGKGETALIAAVERRSDWTAHLLRSGADPNLANRSGETPLIAAARIGYDDAVPWLLVSGAKVNAANRMGETALIIAVQQRRTRIIRLLLEAGADPDKADSAAGLSARDYAQRDTRSRDMIKMIEDTKPKPTKS